MTKKAAEYECDLHTHTNRSDGNDTYEEIIEFACRRGLKVLAITDHDVVPLDYVESGGIKTPLSDYAKAKEICVIRGIEFSCETQVEDVHIVGLGCRFEHPLFEKQQRATAESKIESYRKLCQKLSENGMPVSWEEVLSNNGARISEADVQKKRIFELMAEKGYAADWREAKLLVKHEPCLQVKRVKPSAESAIRLIRETGGIAILAHPFLIEEPIPVWKKMVCRNEFIEYLIEAGLHGIEGAYTYDKTSYRGNQTPEALEREIRSLYEKRISIISGGSDYHHDSKKGVVNARELGEKGVSLNYMKETPLLAQFLY